MSQGGANSSSGSGGLVVETITGNSGGPVSPNAAFNTDFVGNNTTGINIVGTPASNLLTVIGLSSSTTQIGTVALATNAEAIAGTVTDKAIVPSSLAAKLGTQTQYGLAIGATTTGSINWTSAGTDGQIPIAATGADPAFASVTSTGSTITITPGPNTLNLEAGASVPTTFQTNSGNAVPALNILQILGSHGINTNGATNIVDIEIDNAITLGDLSPLGAGVPAITLTTGDASILSGNITMPTTADADNGVYEVNSVPFMHSFGASNTFLGANAGNFTLTGNSNVGIGTGALGAQTTSAGGNTCVGALCGDGILTGGFNTAVGLGSLSAACASSNTAMGFNSLSVYTGGESTAIGAGASNSNVSGTEVTAIGYNSLLNSTGSFNTALGYNSSVGNTTGTNNVALGAKTFQQLAGGSWNIGVGYEAGFLYTTTESDNILIGSQGVVSDNNTIRIGTQGSGSGQQDKCFIAGITGVTVSANETYVVIDTATGELGQGTPTGAPRLNVTALNTGSSPYTALVTEYYFSCDVSGGTLTINLPNAPTTGTVYIVKDSGGDANTNNITVTTVGGVVTIDGATTFVMNTNYEAANFLFNGTSWEVF